jgi:hypothetical protein
VDLGGDVAGADAFPERTAKQGGALFRIVA